MICELLLEKNQFTALKPHQNHHHFKLLIGGITDCSPPGSIAFSGESKGTRLAQWRMNKRRLRAPGYLLPVAFDGALSVLSRQVGEA